MCAKFTQVVARIIPDGPIKEGLRSSYYTLYYNAKHFKENDFNVYYRNGHFAYRFPNGVEFSSYENFADELKRSLKGYLAHHSIRAGETVIDCGAFIGEFTLYAAAAAGPSGRVIAFEPDPAIYKRLLKNIELNGFKNVTVVNKGLWSADGAMKFVGNDVDGYSFIAATDNPAAIEVPVVSLDGELERLGVKKVDFIKMDVEGAEIEALKGAARTLKGNNAGIAIASYHPVNGAKSCFALEKMLPEFSYRAETGHAQHLTTYGMKISR